jgi:hypothetical protein
MKRAFLAVKEQPHYRADAFRAGLQKVGFEVLPAMASWAPTPDDVFVAWNLHGDNERIASRCRAAGAKVIVAENGYFGHDNAGRQLYALALNAHNGAGKWFVGDSERWARQYDVMREQLGEERAKIDAWRAAFNGSYVLICAQRGIGSQQMRSPDGWHNTAAAQIQRMGIPFKIRQHPGALFGAAKSQPSLEQDIANARCVLIWSSSSGVKALMHLVPVVYCAPHWICEGAAGYGVSAVANATFDALKVREALERMAWAQWSVDEIQTGEPFARLLALP